MKKTVTVNIPAEEGEKCLKTKVFAKLGIRDDRGYDFRIVKKSLDARDKRRIVWAYTAEVSDEPPVPPATPLKADRKGKVLVVGSGPAGLFCALTLARGGMEVTLIERGAPVEERSRTVSAFFSGGAPDPDSNAQFGEGGAGTFSDGKLNTQVNNPLILRVLGDFVAFGAPEEIACSGKPHIGSDRLPAVVKAIREEIKRLGGRVFFHTSLTGVKISGGIAEAEISDPALSAERWDEIVLALGHSARDTFGALEKGGVFMESKAFAVGLRIEHPQELIDRAQYGRPRGSLPPADYKLVSHASDRAVFTFCMCPGGTIVPAASERGGVVTNGMSVYARDGKYANSAVVAEIRREDFGGGPLGGMYFQRTLEEAAFLAGGGNYAAPASTVGDFLAGRASAAVSSTYPRGTVTFPLKEILGPSVAETIAQGIRDMGRKLRGFDDPSAVLVGVESRTSSPVRITRGADFASLSAANLYPAGEGAGYAGGITSAAADGIRIAEAIIRKYKR